VFAGPNAWPIARIAARTARVLPEGDDPVAYRWPVGGRSVALAWSRGALADVK
jgi:hypothetical protein